MRRLGLLALVLAAPAVAQTQAQMSAQADSDSRRADAALNAQWARTLAFMKQRDADGPPSGHAKVLLDAQRAWLSFRDTHCRLAGSLYAGGSMQPMVVAQCLADVTRQRTKQLKDLVLP